MEKKYAFRVEFYKEKDAVYLSQLDIFRLFMRALRRAKLPIVFTQGFNPHPKISLGRALKLGKEGQIESTFYFERELSSEEFKHKFTKQIPEGLRLVSIEILN